MKKERKKNVNVFNLFSYIVLIVASILIFCRNLLPLCGVEVGGPLFTTLDTIKDVLVLVMVGIMGYNFIVGKKKVTKIFYWIAIAIFIAGIVLNWI